MSLARLICGSELRCVPATPVSQARPETEWGTVHNVCSWGPARAGVASCATQTSTPTFRVGTFCSLLALLGGPTVFSSVHLPIPGDTLCHTAVGQLGGFSLLSLCRMGWGSLLSIRYSFGGKVQNVVNWDLIR